MSSAPAEEEEQGGGTGQGGQGQGQQAALVPLWAFLEGRAAEWVLSLYRLYQLMQVEQQAVLLDLGYSARERMKLAGMLQEHLETIGITLYSDAGVQALSLSPEEVIKLLPVEMLQTLFYELLCNAPFAHVQSKLTQRLAGFLPFATYHRREYETRYGKLTQGQFRDNRKRPAGGGHPAAPAASGSPVGVPEVPPGNGPVGERITLGRTRRVAGRVGEHYRRAVSEP